MAHKKKKKTQIPCKLGLQNPNKYTKTQPKLPNLKDPNYKRLTVICIKKKKKIALPPLAATKQVAMIATNKLAPLDIYATSTTLPPLQSLVWYEFLTLFIYVLLSTTLTELFLE